MLHEITNNDPERVSFNIGILICLLSYAKYEVVISVLGTSIKFHPEKITLKRDFEPEPS